MRKIGAYLAMAALAAVIFSPPSAAAFGLRIGPFHLGLPFFRHQHRPLYMHAAIPNGGDLAHPEAAQGVTSALLYPSLALPPIYDEIFSPEYAPPWPFGYQAILSTAFADPRPSQDPNRCQPQPDLGNRIVAHMRAGIAPTPAQLQLLQKLGGALGMASGYLAKSCPDEIPQQPVARLRLMESQIQQLSMALDIIRQPLQDFEQSLSDKQKKRFEATIATPAPAGHNSYLDNVPSDCSAVPTAVDLSIGAIDQSVQPTDAQRDALADVKQAFGSAASDLDAHCPTLWPPTARSRLELIEARLDAAWRAILSIQVSLANLEAGLSNEQRTRFDATDFTATQ